MNIDVVEFKKVKYIISKPSNFQNDKKYPVILFLHGAGTRGNDIKVLSNNPFYLKIQQRKEFPFITVAPLCQRDTWFDIFEELIELVKYIYRLDFTDRSHFYGIGASMGGYGIWQLAMSMPEYFAAIVPICGGGMYWNAARLKYVAVWAFHGAEDTVVLPDESIRMVDAVNQFGGTAKLTIYPHTAHNAWDKTYVNDEIWSWLLQHTNQGYEQVKGLTGSHMFG